MVWTFGNIEIFEFWVILVICFFFVIWNIWRFYLDVNELFVIGHLVFGRFVFTLLEICFTQPMRLFYTLFTLPNNFLYLSIIYLPMAKLGSVSTRFPLISYFSTLFIRFMPPIIISSVALKTKNSYLSSFIKCSTTQYIRGVGVVLMGETRKSKFMPCTV